jgi:hypothetical protein
MRRPDGDQLGDLAFAIRSRGRPPSTGIVYTPSLRTYAIRRPLGDQTGADPLVTALTPVPSGRTVKTFPPVAKASFPFRPGNVLAAVVGQKPTASTTPTTARRVREAVVNSSVA